MCSKWGFFSPYPSLSSANNAVKTQSWKAEQLDQGSRETKHVDQKGRDRQKIMPTGQTHFSFSSCLLRKCFPRPPKLYFKLHNVSKDILRF